MMLGLRKFRTLNLIEVSKKALKHNYLFFQKLLNGPAIAPVLKSNAYGHGLKLVGKFVDREIKPPFIIVDSLYEAYELQKDKIKTPILIIGYTFPENFNTFRRLKNLHFLVYDKATLEALNKYQPGCSIHLKIDTGMGRLGLQPKKVKNFIKLLKKYNQVQVEGIYSHLSQAKIPKKKAFTLKQIKAFKNAIHQFEAAGFRFRWKHIAATAGSLLKKDPEFNLVRLGLGFYGYSPFTPRTKFGKMLTRNLKPALKLISHLVQIKKIKNGSEIGYGGTYKATRDMTIGILPIGYYDGLDRRLSNIGKVRMGNKLCPIIGQVCMNVTIIDISSLAQPRVGQRVIIYDSQKEAGNNISNSAQAINTIPYVLLARLSETTRRVLVS